jgi:hypothetical protein
MKWLSGVIIIMVAIAGLYYWKYPNYTYRYRLTVNIEVDGKIHSGSGVIEVTWHGQPELGDVGPFHPTIRGQAPLVDLGKRGVVVASLISKDWGQPSKVGDPWGALFLAPRAFGKSTEVSSIPEFSSQRGPRALAADNLPRFLWFSDPQDPTTAQETELAALQQEVSSFLMVQCSEMPPYFRGPVVSLKIQPAAFLLKPMC